METNTEKLDLWCIVELFGHTKIAGRCTEQNIAGSNMLRVDVPKTETAAEFTKFYGSSAINPVSEEIARVCLKKYRLNQYSRMN